MRMEGFYILWPWVVLLFVRALFFDRDVIHTNHPLFAMAYRHFESTTKTLMVHATTLKLEKFSLPVHTVRLNRHKHECAVSLYTS